MYKLDFLLNSFTTLIYSTLNFKMYFNLYCINSVGNFSLKSIGCLSDE